MLIFQNECSYITILSWRWADLIFDREVSFTPFFNSLTPFFNGVHCTRVVLSEEEKYQMLDVLFLSIKQFYLCIILIIFRQSGHMRFLFQTLRSQ